tara:strand:- start:2903 stop:3052 length:150 start_codon:yes stop_codon:yes gene_type:complete
MADKEDKPEEFDIIRFIKRYWVQNRPFFIFVAFVLVMILMLSSFKYLLH